MKQANTAWYTDF